MSINKQDLKPNKALGQNFLTNENVVRTMISMLEINNNEKIVELGGGIGAITKELVRTANTSSKVEIIELDPRFISVLQDITNGNNQFEVLQEDILSYLNNNDFEDNLKIIGAIPYNITSPIIHKVCYMRNKPKKVVLLIQKEVAEKICAKVPNASYLSSFVQTFFEASLGDIVKRENFYPEPKVDSAILVLESKKEIEISQDQIRKYEGFLHKGYSNPRKMLNKVFTQTEIDQIKVDPMLRPQNIETKTWTTAFRQLVLNS